MYVTLAVQQVALLFQIGSVITTYVINYNYLNLFLGFTFNLQLLLNISG